MDHENGSTSNTRRVQRLKCTVQNYDWGQIGTQSGVARLYSRNSGVEIDHEKPYAELWMGTHASAPSFLIDMVENVGENEKFITLEKWIQQNPHVLGDMVVQNWGTRLPFLFKVPSHSCRNIIVDHIMVIGSIDIDTSVYRVSYLLV